MFAWGNARWFSGVSGIELVLPSINEIRRPFQSHSSLAPPSILSSGLMDQFDDDPQGEPLASVAVAVGLRRARLAVVDRQPDDQPCDRRTTGVIRVEDLGEEHAEGHQRGVDALLET